MSRAMAGGGMTNATTGDVIEFMVGLPPVPLRANSRTTKHAYRAKLVREYQEQVWIAGQMSEMSAPPAYKGVGVPAYFHRLPWPSARVHYRWHSTHQTDEDNIIASMKAALDVLHTKGARPLGIFVDDKDADVTAEWVRERVRSKERVEITITRVQEGSAP